MSKKKEYPTSINNSKNIMVSLKLSTTNPSLPNGYEFSVSFGF